MASKRQFMDPVSSICKIILLKIYSSGTKIRIIDHTIQIVPDVYTERMVFRPWYKDSREDMCALYPVIVRFIELFYNEKKEKEKDSKCFEALQKLSEYSIEGLQSLEKTYGYDNAVFTLKYYSNLLQSSINNTYDQTMLPEHLKDLTSQNLLDITKIKNLWKDENIIYVCKLFDDCFEAISNDRRELINGYKTAIELFLNARDEEFKKMILSTETA
jgi:hypothetical protein